MERRHFLIILIVFLAALVVAGVYAIVALNRKASVPPSALQHPGVAQQAKYAKGSIGFFYPSAWITNDIPASGDLISVQLMSPEDTIVFVASSDMKLNDYKVDGTLTSEKEVTIGGVTGKERVWENGKSQTVVFRADNLKFQDRFFRLELFTVQSRKVKAERYWRDILTTVKFSETVQGTIEANPQ
ncbi:MAG: hypothetical protein AAB581_00045 [Patescibacteria group bacterium]